ncbi:MAG: hypothetical protein JSR66_30085 [Proteobacteria bacterium]|nr:hypothetical protein [Pseudomonadota bacterium]
MTIEGMEGSRHIRRGFHRHGPTSLLILAAGSSAALILIDATPLSAEFAYAIFVIPSVAIAWAAIGVWSGTSFIRNARRRHWKQSLIPGCLLATSVFVACNFFPFIRGCSYLGGALRFAVTRSYYEHQVALLPMSGKPRLVVFSWGGMIWSSRGVVFDESDEIELPPGQQSGVWKAKAQATELSCGNWDARKLSSHFYLVAFPC